MPLCAPCYFHRISLHFPGTLCRPGTIPSTFPIQKKNLKLQCEPTKLDKKLVKFYCGISETLLEIHKTFT